ncbi:MAG: hypothetical protein P8Q57_03820 [Yoonia sp.]|jgi:succinate dehydrogenase/fumarate reductase cytochrome b subunit|nr:hypothetical protein [Yoonia sp.]
MTARRLHRITAYPVAVFIALHLANHIALFWGPEAHLAVQSLLRPIYRNPAVEPLLIAAFAFQIGLGLSLIWQRGWPTRTWPRIQIFSGGILAFFLMQHISATLFTRWAKPEIDTTIYWAASVVSRWEFGMYFAPYCTLGIAALFWHVAATVARHPVRHTRATTIGAAGTIFAIALIVTLAGGVFAIALPAPYTAYLDTFWTL